MSPHQCVFESLSRPCFPVTDQDQVPYSHARKRPTHRTTPSEINGFAEDGTPCTSNLLALEDSPERANPGGEKTSDEELCRRMSLTLYP